MEWKANRSVCEAKTDTWLLRQNTATTHVICSSKFALVSCSIRDYMRISPEIYIFVAVKTLKYIFTSLSWWKRVDRIIVANQINGSELNKYEINEIIGFFKFFILIHIRKFSSQARETNDSQKIYTHFSINLTRIYTKRMNGTQPLICDARPFGNKCGKYVIVCNVVFRSLYWAYASFVLQLAVHTIHLLALV